MNWRVPIENKSAHRGELSKGNLHNVKQIFRNFPGGRRLARLSSTPPIPLFIGKFKYWGGVRITQSVPGSDNWRPALRLAYKSNPSKKAKTKAKKEEKIKKTEESIFPVSLRLLKYSRLVLWELTFSPALPETDIDGLKVPFLPFFPALFCSLDFFRLPFVLCLVLCWIT